MVKSVQDAGTVIERTLYFIESLPSMSFEQSVRAVAAPLVATLTAGATSLGAADAIGVMTAGAVATGAGATGATTTGVGAAWVAAGAVDVDAPGAEELDAQAASANTQALANKLSLKFIVVVLSWVFERTIGMTASQPIRLDANCAHHEGMTS